jgi:hypothetical protein
MTITKTCFCAARPKRLHIGHVAEAIFQPRSVAIATIDARRIDRLIGRRAKLRDLVALECGRSNLGE